MTALREILTPRALAAWAGTDRISTLPLRIPNGPALTPMAELFGLLVAGDEIEIELDPRRSPHPLRSLAPLPLCVRSGTPPARAYARVNAEEERGARERRDGEGGTSSIVAVLHDLAEAGLVEIEENRIRARVSLLPLGRSLLVCDRLDTDFSTQVVCWPDDSSYHLALSIPAGRRERWLDLGCGSGFAPLLRPDLAETIVGADLNPRAVQYATLGAQLSRITHLDVREADLADGITGTFDLITCNAPIPANILAPMWRATADVTLFPRLLQQVPPLLSPDGLVVIHGALARLGPLVRDLRGERVVVSYVPEGGTQFGILWWRPDAPSRDVGAYRELTPDRPHLTHEDRLDVLR
jgi:SAM-dependent methyltransferase